MAKDLLTYISGYHLDIARPSLAIPTKILEMLCKTWEHLIIICIWLVFGCLDGGTWQVITNMAKTAMKTDTHTHTHTHSQLCPLNPPRVYCEIS